LGIAITHTEADPEGDSWVGRGTRDADGVECVENGEGVSFFCSQLGSLGERRDGSPSGQVREEPRLKTDDSAFQASQNACRFTFVVN